MSSDSVFCNTQLAVFSLWLAGAIIAFDSHADPLLSDATEPPFSVPMGDERLLQTVVGSAAHPPVFALPLPHPLLEIGKFDGEGVAMPRGLESGLTNRRALFRNQLARDWTRDVASDRSQVGSINQRNQKGTRASSQERARQGAAQDSRFGESEFTEYPEATFRDAVGNVLQWISDDDVDGKELARFFIAQLGEFRAMLNAELQSVAASISDLSPATPYEHTWSESDVGARGQMQQQSAFSGTAAASGQFPGTPQTDASIRSVADFVTFILREFLTNPIAIIATFGTLIM